jgi:quercetin dioxygenase-like cupin family protein
MSIQNAYDAPREPLVAHGGPGTCEIARLFQSGELQGTWHFIEYLVVPPGVTIGAHRHGANEELYFIITGQATMTINGQTHTVKPGDLIINHPNWEHGLHNDGQTEVKLLVIEVDLKKENSD